MRSPRCPPVVQKQQPLLLLLLFTPLWLTLQVPITAATPTLAPTASAPTTSPPTSAPTTSAPTTPPPTTPAPTTPAPTVCPYARVRRPWGSLSSADKQLYLDAVNASMVAGYHAMFTEVSSELLSANEEYRTCGFLYWNRRFLLAYENMLRSLEPRFACVTVPYWDYFADYAKRQTGVCTTLEGCSTILTDFGGSSGTPSTTVTINGVNVAGTCVSSNPLSNYCQSSTLSSSSGSCSNCVPRDNWSTKAFPSGFGYASLARLVSVTTSYAYFSQNLQYGMFNTMHNALGSTMASSVAAADPIFFQHHATTDLIHSLYYDCQVGVTMTEAQKKSSIYAYQTCAKTSSDICPTVLSSMTMKWEALGGGKVDAELQTKLAPFFSPLPREYWNYVVISDLGDFSYSYEHDLLFGNLVAYGMVCPKNKMRLRRVQLLQLVPTMSTSQSATSAQSLVRTQAVQKTFSLYQNLYNLAYKEVRRADTALEQVELMECLYHDLMLGGVHDTNGDGGGNFHSPTRCFTLLQQMRQGSLQVQVRNWSSYFLMSLGTNFWM